MKLTSINEDYVIDYIREITPKRNTLLEEMEEYAELNHIPIIEPEVAQFIRTILKIKKPLNILEVGTAIGYSALVMCEALDGKCNITTIEKNDSVIEKAKAYISRTPYEDNINIIYGDALEVIGHLKKSYDLIFIDAAKGHYKEFFDDSVKLLNKNGIIISDNVLFRGMVASDELVKRRKKTIVKRLREYLVYINNLEGYTTSIIPLGDGVAITYREV